MQYVISWALPLFLAVHLGNATEEAAPAAKAKYVVVVVWDGMRPDFITSQYTPALYELATKGVFFKNHHSVYVSSTEVNGAALATGAYPYRSGIIANRDYRPEIEWGDSAGTESVEAIRRGDLLTGGHYIAVPTVAELLQQAGFPTVVAGTKPVALLQDRANRRTSEAARDSKVLYNGKTIPSSLQAAVVKANDKDFPGSATPNVARDAWTTKGLTEVLWKHGVPKFSVLWLSEPDASQHATSPGSDTSLAALESNDNNLAKVIKTLESKGIREQTDIFVVSDHGFSTIQRVADVTEILKKANFKAGKKLDDPEPGDVVVVGLGGCVMLYVIDRDETVIRRLAQFLQGTDFAGVILSRLPIEGTFPLEKLRLNSTNPAPDLVLSLRWSDERNQYGAPGLVVSEGGKKGDGTHASLSPYDLHNILVAAGPDLRSGFINELPTGNADLAPTILHLLGLKSPGTMDGRVLAEALVGTTPTEIKPKRQLLEADRDLGPRRWHQYLEFTTYGDQIYFDQGNGSSLPK